MNKLSKLLSQWLYYDWSYVVFQQYFPYFISIVSFVLIAVNTKTMSMITFLDGVKVLVHGLLGSHKRITRHNNYPT